MRIPVDVPVLERLMAGALLSLAGAVVIHEAGHALTAQALGKRWRLFLRFPVALGVAAEPSRLVAAAGPVASILAGLVASALGWEMLAIANLFLGVVSLVPVPPQDGWRLIRG